MPIFASEPRIDPRISVKPLGDYMTASPAARKGIVKRQKNKPGYVPRYRDAYEGAKSLLTGERDVEMTLNFADDLRNREADDDQEAQRNLLCAEALERLVETVDALPLDGVTIEAGSNDPKKLIVGPVRVSVRPEFILHAKDKKGNAVTGALKLCFTKTSPLEKDQGEYIATTVHQYVEEVICAEDPPAVARELSLVLDVFSGNIYVAPKAFKRRRGDIQSACEEIAMWWHAL